MAKDEASFEVAPRGWHPHDDFADNITHSEKFLDNDKYGTGSLVTRER
jgi:hypothetical protein